MDLISQSVLCTYKAQQVITMVKKSSTKGIFVTIAEHVQNGTCYRNNTSGNVRRRQAAKKASTENSDDVVVVGSSSSSSVPELADTPKPEMNYCRNKKNDFENRIVQWMENESKMHETQLQKLDEINHSMANMALMICHDLTVQDMKVYKTFPV